MRLPHWLKLAVLGLGGLAVSACQGDDRELTLEACSTPLIEDSPVMEFRDAWAPVASASVAVGGNLPVTSLRRLSFDGSGRVAAADARSAQVVMLNEELRALQVVGRRGSGPGEFESPYDVAILDGGSLAVADPGHMNVTVFDSAGQYTDSFRLHDQDPRLVFGGDDGSVWVVGLSGIGRDNHLLAKYDNRGKKLFSLLEADSLLFQTNLMVDAPFGARDDRGRWFLGLEMLPDVYRVDADQRVACVMKQPPPGWQMISVPAEPFQSLSAATDWVTSATVGHGAFWVDGEGFIRNYSHPGDRESNTSRITVYSADLNPVAHYRGVPGRVVGAQGDTVWTVQQAVDSLVLKGYRVSPRRRRAAADPDRGYFK